MSFSKRVLDPDGYGPPPVTTCCGVVPTVKSLQWVCPKCGNDKNVKVRDR